MRTIKRNELMAKLGAFQSVCNTPSRNGYSVAPNQFELIFENGKVFQSYSSLIAVRYKREWYFTSMHGCSNTTSRHLGNFCGYSLNERRKGLADGTFIMIED